MRRTDREIVDRERLRELILTCDCCRLGIASEDGPYIVPLNFGYEEQNGRGVFYFHCAKEGYKLELLKENPRVGFELDTDHTLRAAEKACGYTFLYASVIGRGTVVSVTDKQEKKAALARIMEHYSGKADWTFSDAEIGSVAILRLDVAEMTGKEHR